jgi:hypothetical protein
MEILLFLFVAAARMRQYYWHLPKSIRLEEVSFIQVINSIVAVRRFCSNDRRPLSSPMFTECLSFEINSDIHPFID